MKRLGLILLAATLAFVGVEVEAADNDLDRLQGTWSMVALERNGKAATAERIKDRVVVIEGSTFVDRTGDKIHGKGTIKLDPAQTPGAVEATFTEGPPKGKTALGIYAIDGDTFKACCGEPGDDERPMAFATRPGSGQMFVVLRRAKP
jgi:uncharacterized protein (TIGR03067 family)